MAKNIVIKEETLKLYNKAKAKILGSDYNLSNLSDDKAMKKILKNFLGV